MTSSTYDVLVVGGGSAGVVAAVQAARAGARTLLIEKSGLLGGTTTLGGVNFPGLFHAWGRQVIAGIGWEWVTTSVREAGDALPDFTRWREGRHWRMQVLVNSPVHAAVADQLIQDAGAEVLFHTMIASVKHETDGWRVILCGKEGLRSVSADVLIDCTGDANLVGLAGFPLHRNSGLQPGTLVMRAGGYDFDKLELDSLERAFIEAVARGEMQRSDFQAAQRPVSAFLHNRGGNSIHVPGIDASTSEGKTRAELLARAAMLRIVRFLRGRPGLEHFKIEWCAPECGIRETVTIEGETRLTRDDYATGRVWPDSLCHSFYPIDLHAVAGQGGIDTRYLEEGTFPTIPLGALLPKGSRRLIVAGRCASGDQEANSAFRVQASAMAMGQVAGAAAALAANTGRELREVPLAEIRTLLQRHQAIVPACPVSLAADTKENDAPAGLLCDLLAHPERTVVRTVIPAFGWMVNGGRPGAAQSAFQLRVGVVPGKLKERGECWDSGVVPTANSLNVAYAGTPLAAGKRYWWTVRTWHGTDKPGAWAAPQSFIVSAPPDAATSTKEDQGEVSVYPLDTVEVPPVRFERKGDGLWSLDFGRQAFGWLELDVESAVDGGVLEAHLGEARHAGALDRNPPGSVRYASSRVILRAGRHRYRVHTLADTRNTGPRAIHLPSALGTVMPFRYVEAETGTGPSAPLLHGAALLRVEYPFDTDASAFHSSEDALNAVWDLCHYTIRATTFAGYYVDGDRERIPYEADAYINQLSHYAVDREFSLARRTHEYLLLHSTWPTEWKQHSILIAWADYEATGDDRSLRRHYETLKNEKLLLEHAREDGLLTTGRLRDPAGPGDVGDLVDWPPVERDGFDFRGVNTVINAFHYRTLVLMTKIATALGKDADSASFTDRARTVFTRFNEVLFDATRGMYVDGEGSEHVSQHGNLFPLAFGLVPTERLQSVVTYVKSRGMACSVYPAQYLLEGLFEAREAEHALDLMTGGGLRSWKNMLDHGATLTWEAWDQSLKPNQDWNHAWATAPVNIIARYVLGVRPLEPGYRRVLVDPQLGRLNEVRGTVPTIRGPIHVHAWRDAEGEIRYEAIVPANVELQKRG